MTPAVSGAPAHNEETTEVEPPSTGVEEASGSLFLPGILCEYSSFGQELLRTGSASSRFGYQGTAWMRSSIDLLISPTRLYLPGVGRFAQREPVPAVATHSRVLKLSSLGRYAISAFLEAALEQAAPSMWWRYRRARESYPHLTIRELLSAVDGGRPRLGVGTLQETVTSSTGRPTKDSWLRSAALELYALCSGSPPVSVDPSGLYTIDVLCCCSIESYIKGTVRVIEAHVDVIGEGYIRIGSARRDLRQRGFTTGAIGTIGSVRRGLEPTCITEAKASVESWVYVPGRAVGTLSVGALAWLGHTVSGGSLEDAARDQTTWYLISEWGLHVMYLGELGAIRALCLERYGTLDFWDVPIRENYLLGSAAIV
jgi:hypothetical protein